MTRNPRQFSGTYKNGFTLDGRIKLGQMISSNKGISVELKVYNNIRDLKKKRLTNVKFATQIISN